MISPCFFNIYVDGCVREMKARMGDVGDRLVVEGAEKPLVPGLYTDDTGKLAER